MTLFGLILLLLEQLGIPAVLIVTLRLATFTVPDVDLPLWAYLFAIGLPLSIMESGEARASQD